MRMTDRGLMAGLLMMLAAFVFAPFCVAQESTSVVPASEDPDGEKPYILVQYIEEPTIEEPDSQEPTSEVQASEVPARELSVREAEIVPEVIDGRFRMPPLRVYSIATDNIGNGRTPTSYRDESNVPVERLPESASERGVPWNWTICNWAAADTFSNPRYFEDRMLERHGHQRFGRLQPFASGARFFVTMPMLPYLMTVREPCDKEYTLGYYRSGSRTPAFLQRPPYERRAVVAESAAIAGAIIAFP